jgi:D-sedoheptulose 7-phosphate isomerase
MYLDQLHEIINYIDCGEIEHIVINLLGLKRRGGRLFIIGLGGSSSNASHACNDFRKIANIESYCLTDNISELTARINDEGFDNCFVGLLKSSNLSSKDMILFLSVGGGNLEKNISVPIINAVDYAMGLKVVAMGIIGRDGGYVLQTSQCGVLIPPLFPEFITPHTESLQSVILHLLVSHPLLKINETKWENEK